MVRRRLENERLVTASFVELRLGSPTDLEERAWRSALSLHANLRSSRVKRFVPVTAECGICREQWRRICSLSERCASDPRCQREGSDGGGMVAQECPPGLRWRPRRRSCQAERRGTNRAGLARAKSSITTTPGHSHEANSRCGAPLIAIIELMAKRRRKRFSTSSRRCDLNKVGHECPTMWRMASPRAG
jgi:bacterioferritin-associated ferredoxin